MDSRGKIAIEFLKNHKSTVFVALLAALILLPFGYQELSDCSSRHRNFKHPTAEVWGVPRSISDDGLLVFREHRSEYILRSINGASYAEATKLDQLLICRIITMEYICYGRYILSCDTVARPED